LSFFKKTEFKNYWYASGSPSFLVNLIKEHKLDPTKFNAGDCLTDSVNVIDLDEASNPKALMFQAGYLTVDKVERLIGDPKFYLRFPNLEVQAAVARLWLFLPKPLDDPLTMKTQAEALLARLVNRDAAKFEEAFESFLSSLPYQSHLPYEAYYQTVFLLALTMAGQSYEAEGSVGDGRFDVHLRLADGTDHIVEIKHVDFSSSERKITETKKRERTKKPATDKQRDEQSERRELMNKAIIEALAQIEKNKYSKKFQGSDNEIYKTALVIGGRADVGIVFERAANWSLKKDKFGGYYKVSET
jgi:hypothetical protein